MSWLKLQLKVWNRTYNEPRYNEFFDITNIIRKPKRKIYLDITNYNHGQQATEDKR